MFGQYSGWPSTGNFHELVCYLEEHRKEYVRFIMFGEE